MGGMGQGVYLYTTQIHVTIWWLKSEEDGPAAAAVRKYTAKARSRSPSDDGVYVNNYAIANNVIAKSQVVFKVGNISGYQRGTSGVLRYSGDPSKRHLAANMAKMGYRRGTGSHFLSLSDSPKSGY